jgi:hypothetical protein
VTSSRVAASLPPASSSLVSPSCTTLYFFNVSSMFCPIHSLGWPYTTATATGLPRSRFRDRGVQTTSAVRGLLGLAQVQRPPPAGSWLPACLKTCVCDRLTMSLGCLCTRFKCPATRPLAEFALLLSRVRRMRSDDLPNFYTLPHIFRGWWVAVEASGDECSSLQDGSALPKYRKERVCGGNRVRPPDISADKNEIYSKE